MEITYRIIHTKKALKDWDYWKRSGDRTVQRKISNLIKSIEHTPFEGIGAPEQLKYLHGLWSRRISKGQ